MKLLFRYILVIHLFLLIDAFAFSQEIIKLKLSKQINLLDQISTKTAPLKTSVNFDGYSNYPQISNRWLGHCCSNCLESLFSKFKEKLPANPLNGITKQVLTLPLRTNKGLSFDIKSALEQVSIADLDRWGKIVLTDNQVLRRQNILKT